MLSTSVKISGLKKFPQSKRREPLSASSAGREEEDRNQTLLEKVDRVLRAARISTLQQ